MRSSSAPPELSNFPDAEGNQPIGHPMNCDETAPTSGTPAWRRVVAVGSGRGGRQFVVVVPDLEEFAVWVEAALLELTRRRILGREV